MRRTLTEAVVATAAAATVYHRWLQPRAERWGATDAEVREVLPGDDLVAPPATQTTRAVTIAAPREQVWPWLVQLGADRGGFYRYDWLEDVFRLGIHNADRVVPAWQHRAVGDLVHADAAGTGGWYVARFEPPELMVLQMADVPAGRPARRDEGMRWEFLWTFVVRDRGDGTTRLIVRERVGCASRRTALLLAPAGLVSFVMSRSMLLGIKRRAESRVAVPAPSPTAQRTTTTLPRT